MSVDRKSNARSNPDFLAGGGEMGARIRDFDWSSTPLGSPETWPQSLRSALSICLNSSVPTAIYWGPEQRLLYNDAWSPVPAERHPWALGRTACEVWDDIWGVVGSQFAHVMETGEGFSTYDQMLPMVRGGAVCQTYWNYSFTPIRGEDGSVAGIFHQGHEITDRVLSERRGVAELERLRRMFDQAPGFMAMLRGPDHIFELVNAAYLQLIGHRDIIGRSVREAVPEVASQGFFEILDRVYATGQAFTGMALPVELQRTPGRPSEQRFVDLIFQPLADAEGTITGIFAEGYDVTDRVHAEAELRESEARLRELNGTLEQRVAEVLTERKALVDLFETTSDFVQILDRDYRFVAINQAMADEYQRIFGFRPYVGDNLLKHFDGRPEQLERAKALWGRVFAGETFGEIRQLGDPQFDRCWYDLRFGPVRSPAGDVIGASLFGYDASARVREQQQLEKLEAARREADALYRAYFENTAEALFVVGILKDGGFTVEELNPAHQKLTGLDMAEMRGKRLEDQLPPDVAAEVAKNYRRVIAEGRPISYREVVDLPAGSRHWDTVLVPVTDGLGRVTKIMGSSRDVTARVYAEEQLRQSQKLEAMGSLTGGVSHDFNNLLTPIIGVLDLLQRKGLGGDREKRLIDGALQSAERARVLVQRLLSFARRQPLRSTSVNIGKLVDGMADLISSTTGPQIRVVVEVSGTVPAAVADQNQLEMALLNLAVNARDAMPDGGTLRITAAGETIGLDHVTGLSPGDYVRLSVADTGVGMDAETARRSIEPFYSTKGVGKGTGLGLSMVHGLAAQLGGALTIASQPDIGTNVELWLPAGAAAPLESEGQAVERTRVHAKGLVLLVDDEELARASTGDMLEELGFEVVSAGSAEEALRSIDGGLRPSLVVTDHLMPGRSGSDLALEIRGRWPELPVLLISGYAEAEGVAPDLARLVKPFRQTELADSIAELTSRLKR